MARQGCSEHGQQGRGSPTRGGTGLKVPIYCLCNIISRQRFSFSHSGSILCIAFRASPVSDTLQTECEEELRTGESMLGLSRRCQVVSTADCWLLTANQFRISNIKSQDRRGDGDRWWQRSLTHSGLGNYYHQATNFGMVTTGGLQILILFSQER